VFAQRRFLAGFSDLRPSRPHAVNIQLLISWRVPRGTMVHRVRFHLGRALRACRVAAAVAALATTSIAVVALAQEDPAAMWVTDGGVREGAGGETLWAVARSLDGPEGVGGVGFVLAGPEGASRVLPGTAAGPDGSGTRFEARAPSDPGPWLWTALQLQDAQGEVREVPLPTPVALSPGTAAGATPPPGSDGGLGSLLPWMGIAIGSFGPGAVLARRAWFGRAARARSEAAMNTERSRVALD